MGTLLALLMGLVFLRGSYGIFCKSTLYYDHFVCDDGNAVGENGCCADTQGCPSSCMSASWATSGSTKTCTCTNCNYAERLTLSQNDRYLLATNYFRCRHGQNALTWDAAVAATAQTWADTCPSQGSNPPHVRPDGTTAYDLTPSSGENVAAGQQSPEKAVEDWYSEITSPGYQPGGPTAGTGHYTALIWKSTTQLGCAQKACESGTPKPVHVCHYSNTPPNFGDASAYVENVPQVNTPSQTEDACCKSVYSSKIAPVSGATTVAVTSLNWFIFTASVFSLCI